jgi:hypothetical protein
MENNKAEKKQNEILGVSPEELTNIAQAVTQVYPMIVLANLTKNTYTLLRNDEFLCNDVEVSGCYEDLIEGNVENIHTNYQHLFEDCFSREHMLKCFEEGKTEVYAEVYQKNKKEQYQWVSAHAIKLENESGDIQHICFNRVLDGIVQERYGGRK